MSQPQTNEIGSERSTLLAYARRQLKKRKSNCCVGCSGSSSDISIKKKKGEDRGMAPLKPLRTYSTRPTSSVRNLNVLLVENMTKRLISKKGEKLNDPNKLSCQVKSFVSNDTFEVSLDDTFDKLRKGSNNNRVSKRKNYGCSIVTNTTCSFKNINESQHCDEPIIISDDSCDSGNVINNAVKKRIFANTKNVSYSSASSDQWEEPLQILDDPFDNLKDNIISENLVTENKINESSSQNTVDKSLLRRFAESTETKLYSLEIEREDNRKETTNSLTVPQNITEDGTNISFNKEKIVYCSTPYIKINESQQRNRKRSRHGDYSPTNDIKKSYEVVKQWNTSLTWPTKESPEDSKQPEKNDTNFVNSPNLFTSSECKTDDESVEPKTAQNNFITHRNNKNSKNSLPVITDQLIKKTFSGDIFETFYHSHISAEENSYLNPVPESIDDIKDRMNKNTLVIPIEKLPVVKDNLLKADNLINDSFKKISSNSCSISSENSLESAEEHTDVLSKKLVINITRMNNRQSKLYATGKSWRRSVIKFRNNSINDADDRDESNIALGRRRTIRFVPVDSSDEESEADCSETDLSYVSEFLFQDLGRSLQLWDISLKKEKRCTSARNSVAAYSARDIVLRKCEQVEPKSFQKCYSDRTLQNCQKIGEGVYGEVFLLKNPLGGTSVIKIIPIEGSETINGETQKKFEEILSEIIISKELSNLRENDINCTSSFNEVQKIQCIKGRYPERLLELWDLYDEVKGSENDCPDIFKDEQLYITIEQKNGGTDLESYQFNNAFQVYSIIQQIAFALAVAEVEFKFEHRDLHWGNVLVATVDKKSKLTYRLNSRTYVIPTQGVEATIIDFTLSRMEHNGIIIFNDISKDEELFAGEGDYQFDVYKRMRERNGNDWKKFEPYSNVLWLHYILDKAISALYYKNGQSKVHKEYMAKLKNLWNKILAYQSVYNFVMDYF